MERLKRMSVFAKVVELGSFTAAARQLQMSVSSISQTVSKLEDELQVKLLNRSTRSIGLTEAGKIYYQGCRRMLLEVRDVMEKCHIHLFTSNYLEGWGAVVNEGMNSGCVEVVNAQVGAAPYLIRHGENGLVYPDDNYGKLEELVLSLCENWEQDKKMGKAAYETILDYWNADHAAAELLRFVTKLQQGRIEPAKEGPLSEAPAIRPGKMYEKMLQKEL